MSSVRMLGVVLGALGVTMALGCGGSLRTAPLGPPGARASRAAPYPPPPAKVEHIATDPGEPCVWRDGYYRWEGQRWVWLEGAWEVPQSGCTWSAPRGLWLPTSGRGEFIYTEPGWYRAQEGKDPVACGAARACT
ncbi:MAG TPA: hypothetical protein VF989_05755 [Polyangiaceae bacterium]